MSKWQLILEAGSAVARAAETLSRPGDKIVVLAGPGNNGGDGFVAAEMLRRVGQAVRVVSSGGTAGLRGNAARAASGYAGPVELLRPETDFRTDVIIDALFGVGLSRELDGLSAEAVMKINSCGAPVLAVDLPSGVDGLTGEIRGAAVQATHTVTFTRLKPGHLLLPGKEQCGFVQVTDIGVPDVAVASVGSTLFENSPGLWLGALLRPSGNWHKYKRGHALVMSGPTGATGAARLATMAALRAGAGLVTLASTSGAMAENAAQLTSVMLRRVDRAGDLAEALADRRFTAVAIGPGAGRGEPTCEAVLACLGSSAAVVLDADAITAFAGAHETLFAAIRTRPAATVMTPHDGEFARLFPDLATEPDKVLRSRSAALRCGAVVVLKGPDTVVASPDGSACINAHASPWLATAGSGDVLTGIVAGLLAQGMPAFEAASASVWLHGDAGRGFGPGLIAEDLPGLLPRSLRQFF